MHDFVGVVLHELGHAWIQGAIESGLRAAQEIHMAP
jgi:monoamine oxidase